MIKSLVRCLTFVVLCLSTSMASAQFLAPYKTGDWKEILRSHAGKPLIVHFWGFTCGPCLEELPKWGKFLQDTSAVKTLFIEVDQIPEAIAAKTLLDAGLAHADNRSSTVYFDEYMRYEIDPNWMGELPITLLIDASGQVKRLRGTVNFSVVRTWLAAQDRGR